MTLTPGTKLDGYEILGPLGAGGMGEVYRARDPGLKREVAIKVLPAYFSQDPDRLRRFEQEAQAAAALNHPNILAVHRFGTFEGAPYLVSELLEGGTLGQLLARGPLPVRKTIDYGVQIASGLAAAHEKGIVHRDLKPDNIFVTNDGRGKILDFGLAKLTQAKPATSDGPTITLHEPTGVGHVLGTVGYMSPEQVRGVAVDHRADIFAFGAILYEMLAGKRAFRKPTSAETLTAILHEDPPGISQIVPGPSPALLRIVQRCLEKDPEQRFHSASDLAFALEALSDSGKVPDPGYRLVAERESPRERVPQGKIDELPSVASESGSRVPQPKPASPWWKRKATIAVAACLIVASLLYPWMAPQFERQWRLHELQQLKVVPLTALAGNVASPSFSPDGSQVVFAWDGENNGAGYDLYVKVVGSDEPLRLTHHPSTALAGAWSPDGRSIAISRSAGEMDSGIYLVAPTGGPERKLGARNVSPWYGGNEMSWSPDGKYLAYTDIDQGQSRKLDLNGRLQLFLLSLDTLQKTRVETNCDLVTAPRYSPSGKFLAFVCFDTSTSSSLRLLRLKDGTQAQLLRRDDGIFDIAWSRDERRIVFSSEPNYGALWETPLARPSQIEILPVGHDATELAAVPLGPGLAYVQASSNVNIWRLDLLASPPQARKLVASTRDQTAPSISPDGSMIAFGSTRSGVWEIWVSDADGSNAQKVTDLRHPSTGTPRWSPDGKLIAFDSRMGGEANIYLVDPRGGVPRKLNIDIRGNNLPSWSRDGAWIYFVNGEDVFNSTVWKVPSSGGHAVQIAKHAASFPLESPDGLYVYFARDSKLWRARTDGSTEELVAGVPQLSFLGDEWFPTEAGIYFLSHPDNKTIINFFDLQTRKVQPIFTLEKPTPIWIGGMPVSKDGKFMLFPQVDQASSDLMLIENWR